MPAARFEGALALMPSRGVMADIGAGDGLLARALAARAGVFHVFATELAAGPYQRLAQACAGEQKIELRRGDGLVPLIGEPLDGVAVLGMGGRTILGILELAPSFPRARFVLGPMQAAADLRRGLHAYGLRIVDEALVLQGGRPYPLIAVHRGRAPQISALDAVLGPVLRQTRPEGFRLLVERQRHLLAARLRGASGAERAEILKEIAAVEAEGDEEL